jgi:hypothetical protein
VEQSAVPMPAAPGRPTKRASTQKPSGQTGTGPLQLCFDDLAASGPP